MLHDKYFETDEKISCRIDDSITPFYNTIHRLLWWVDKSEWIHFLFSSLFSRENWISSVIRQKGEFQNGCFKKRKHAKFSEERTFLNPLKRTCVSRGKKCSFFGKFGVLCFPEHPFWDSPFCLFTDDFISLLLFFTAWCSLDTSGKTLSWISYVCSMVFWD